MGGKAIMESKGGLSDPEKFPLPRGVPAGNFYHGMPLEAALGFQKQATESLH